MSGVKYSIEEYAPKIGEFLNRILGKARIELNHKLELGTEIHPDYETPDIMVQFSGPDVDLLLANKAELLLALELLTQEAIDMPPEDHSRLCFDANDYRMLRVRELLLSAETAAERVKSTGRPFFFSLAAGGQEGVARALELIGAEVRNDMALLGATSVAQIDRSYVLAPSGR